MTGPREIPPFPVAVMCARCSELADVEVAARFTAGGRSATWGMAVCTVHRRVAVDELLLVLDAANAARPPT